MSEFSITVLDDCVVEIDDDAPTCCAGIVDIDDDDILDLVGSDRDNSSMKIKLCHNNLK